MTGRAVDVIVSACVATTGGRCGNPACVAQLVPLHVSTYGTWLPGDERGWREQHHHERVAGDYKHRPARTRCTVGMRTYAQRLMRDGPYLISAEQRSSWANCCWRASAIRRRGALS